VASYSYDNSTQELISYDNVAEAKLKATYIRDARSGCFGGFIIQRAAKMAARLSYLEGIYHMEYTSRVYTIEAIY